MIRTNYSTCVAKLIKKIKLNRLIPCLPALLLVQSVTPRVDGKVLTVGPIDHYLTLSSAVSGARAGDTIVVQSATYTLNNLQIDKPIALLGKDWPTLTASENSHLVSITASNVVISGFIFKGVPISFTKENAAIRIDTAHNCEVIGNRFYDNFFGVYLAGSHHCRVANNEIVGSAKNLTTAGNGIHLWKCHDILIEQNRIEKHRDGIYLEFVTASVMQHNISRENLRYGLHFMFSDSCRYTSNQFIQNGAGVAVMYTAHVDMTDNVFEDSWGGASYGLLLKDIKDSRVTDNHIANNSVGIYLEGSDRIEIQRNTFIANGWAVKIMANCVDAEIHGNNFIDNSFQVTTNSRQTFSRFYENYWSTYRGFDLDHDGCGDVPFRPVSLFSLLVESDPATLVLVRSLLVDLLNLAECVMPSLTPEALTDAKPLMRPAI